MSLFTCVVYHPSPHHSAMALDDLDALSAEATYRLGPGDGVFIPEGWWHQVDSVAGTIGVNFWFHRCSTHALPCYCTDP